MLATFQPYDTTTNIIYSMPNNVGSRTFLVHTNHHTRPFLVVIPFMARDFAEWGFIVEHKASSSAYIKELRSREAQEHMRHLTHKNRYESRRTKLLEIWGQEIVSRGLQESTDTETPVLEATWGFGDQDKRLKRIGTVVQDFFASLAFFGGAIPKDLLKFDIREPHKKPSEPALPAHLRIIRNYMRLLDLMRHSPNVPLPPWANPDIHKADLITIDFKNHEAVTMEHLRYAMTKAANKDDGVLKMGRTLKVVGTNRVLLYVDVADCMLLRGMEEETWDPLPLYERGEHPPGYVEVCG
jgi:hypothetical protein